MNRWDREKFIYQVYLVKLNFKKSQPLLKIGITADLLTRMSTIRRINLSESVFIFGVIPVKGFSNARKIEKDFLKTFSDSRRDKKSEFFIYNESLEFEFSRKESFISCGVYLYGKN